MNEIEPTLALYTKARAYCAERGVQCYAKDGDRITNLRLKFSRDSKAKLVRFNADDDWHDVQMKIDAAFYDSGAI